MRKILFAFIFPIALLAGDENMATLTDLKDAVYILLKKYEKSEIDKEEMIKQIKSLTVKIGQIDSATSDLAAIKNKLRQLNIDIPNGMESRKTEYYDRILEFNQKNHNTLGR